MLKLMIPVVAALCLALGGSCKHRADQPGTNNLNDTTGGNNGDPAARSGRLMAFAGWKVIPYCLVKLADVPASENELTQIIEQSYATWTTYLKQQGIDQRLTAAGGRWPPGPLKRLGQCASAALKIVFGSEGVDPMLAADLQRPRDSQLGAIFDHSRDADALDVGSDKRKLVLWVAGDSQQPGGLSYQDKLRPRAVVRHLFGRLLGNVITPRGILALVPEELFACADRNEDVCVRRLNTPDLVVDPFDISSASPNGNLSATSMISYDQTGSGQAEVCFLGSGPITVKFTDREIRTVDDLWRATWKSPRMQLVGPEVEVFAQNTNSRFYYAEASREGFVERSGGTSYESLTFNVRAAMQYLVACGTESRTIFTTAADDCKSPWNGAEAVKNFERVLAECANAP